MNPPARLTRLVITLLSVVAALALPSVAAAAPAATISVSDSTPETGQAVTFTASGDECADLVIVCVWAGDDNLLGAGDSIQHTYNTPGTYAVTLVVDDLTDSEGPVTSQPATVAVSAPPPPPNRPPRITGITITPSSPIAGQSLTITAAGNDPDGDALTWSLAVDGNRTDGNTRTLTLPAGEHRVVARVNDGRGGSADEARRFTVAPPPNVAPQVGLSHAPGSPLTGQEVTFTAAVTDPDGGAPRFSWSVDGGRFQDGNATRRVTFNRAGRYTVAVRVGDGRGGTDEASDTVTVSVPPNRPPQIGAFGPSPNVFLTLQDVTFAPSVTDDKGNLSYRWSVNGQQRGTGPRLAVQFPLPVTYQVQLAVTDSDGDRVTRSVEVKPVNRAPQVDFAWEPESVQRGDTVTFTSEARDPEGLPLRNLAWDLDGDAEYDDAIGDLATRRFTDSEAHTIGLRATDQHGGAAVLRQNLVIGNRVPKAAFTVSPAAPQPNQDTTFTSSSSDPDGDIVAQAWDLDGDGEFDDATGAAATIRYATVAKQHVALKVTDDDGGTDVEAIEVDVGSGEVLGGVAGARNLLSPFPRVRIAGRVTSRGAYLRLVTVEAPKGARIRVRCVGRRCPRTNLAVTARTMRLKRLQGFYRAGSVLEFRITRAGRIGKFTRIRILANQAPTRRDQCLYPGRAKPRACPPTGGAAAPSTRTRT